MGVDTRIYLPYQVRLRDAADVVGKLLGLPSELKPLQFSDNGAKHVCVDGVSTTSYGEGYGLHECAKIVLHGCTVGPWTDPEFMWYFEPDRGVFGLAMRIMPHSTPHVIAMAEGLVNFFGGAIQYQDHTNHGDYFVESPDDFVLAPQNGDAWEAMQIRIHELKPVEVTERHWSLAAYNDRPGPRHY